MCTHACTGQTKHKIEPVRVIKTGFRLTSSRQGSKSAGGQMSHPYSRVWRKDDECVRTDSERKSEGGREADGCVALGSLLQIWLNYLLARRKEGVSKVFNSKQTHGRLPKLTAINFPFCQDAAEMTGWDVVMHPSPLLEMQSPQN